MYRIPALVSLLVLACPLATQAAKQRSALYPPALTARAKANAARYPWAARMQSGIVEQARPWMRFSEDELWSLMFGCTITRSHMVWSAGFCPACRRPVPMYDWQIDALERPWKVRCPHCREQFPKNDFQKFYRSGLDAQGVFDPRRADRKLLVNAEHPDPADPLHRFGVDDGEGYVEGSNRWRFIGAYLLYGQWWQAVLGGIEKLAAAYTVTGETPYAHRAAILLDRVADVFPTFDYATQGLVYERARYGGGAAGYVSYAINSANDVRRLALAYDQVFDGMKDDAGLVRFLSAKSASKNSVEAIRANIEQGILRDALAHPQKMRTNYPGREGSLAILNTVLDWPASRTEVLASIGAMVEAGTSVDGLSGEKGLNGYAAIAPRFLAHMLELYSRAEPGLVEEMLRLHPKFARTYGFFTDLWVSRQYYPSAGDAGAFTVRDPRYAALAFNVSGKTDGALPVSAFSFLWRMYQATHDPLYLRIMRQGNDGKVDGLPYDLFAEDPEALTAAVEKAGPFPPARSVDKTEWRIAMLRSPRDERAAVWLDYDSVPNCKIKNHYHRDAMNLGLYAYGLDLLPEFGYPAVQFGSWDTPQALWHKKTAAHNTVVVDGRDQAGGDGRTTLWADGAGFRAVRASSPAEYGGSQYERTAVMVDTAGGGFYVLDVFRVAGGQDHARFMHGAFGEVSTRGLRLVAAPDYGHGTLTRSFRGDARPEPGWSVDWKVDDKFSYLAPGSDVHLAYTDLTTGAEAYLCESWTVRNATSAEQFWVPTVVTRRRGNDLRSTFVGVLEPYEKRSAISGIRRLPLAGDGQVAVEVRLADGRRDILIAAGEPQTVEGISFSGELALVRYGTGGGVERVALARGSYVRAGEVELRLKDREAFVELEIGGGGVSLASGNGAAIGDLRLRGQALKLR